MTRMPLAGTADEPTVVPASGDVPVQAASTRQVTR